MASVTQTTERNLSTPSWLEQYLYGSETQALDPDLKSLLVQTGKISADTSDADAVKYWNQNQGTLSQRGGGDIFSSLFPDPNQMIFEAFAQGKDGRKAVTTGGSTTGGQIGNDFQALRSMADAWGGNAEALAANPLIANARGANDKLAEMLTAMRENGGMPTDKDIAAGLDTSNKLYQGQRTALNQRFEDTNTQYAQRAAAMGRDVMDPILQAKLAQEKTRQGAQLASDEGATAQQYAMNLPGQRLSYQQMMVDLQGGLAQQAWNNRSAIMSAGMQLGQNERNWRLGTAGSTSTSVENKDFFESLASIVGIGGTAISAGSKLFGGAPQVGGGGGQQKMDMSGVAPTGNSMTSNMDVSMGVGGIGYPMSSGGRTYSTGSAYAPGGNWMRRNA